MWRAEEKGIDVLLAVDVVRGAYMDEFGPFAYSWD